MSARYFYRKNAALPGCSRYDIVDEQTNRVVDTVRNEARARLLVVRYNREAAK